MENLSKYFQFANFDEILWINWIQKVSRSEPAEPELGYDEPRDNLNAAYNYLIREKLNIEAFSSGLASVFNKTPKTNSFASELFQLLQVIAYVKPENYTPLFIRIFKSGVLENIYYDGYLLQQIFADCLTSFTNIQLDDEFDLEVNKIQSPNITLIGLRYFYKRRGEDMFFKQVPSIFREIENMETRYLYIDSMVFVLNEMAITLHNYKTIFEWVTLNAIEFDAKFPLSFNYFISQMDKELQDEVSESQNAYASLLKGIIQCNISLKDSSRIIKKEKLIYLIEKAACINLEINIINPFTEQLARIVEKYYPELLGHEFTYYPEMLFSFTRKEGEMIVRRIKWLMQLISGKVKIKATEVMNELLHIDNASRN